MRHISSRIKSYDRRIAKLKAGMSWMTRAWDRAESEDTTTLKYPLAKLDSNSIVAATPTSGMLGKNHSLCGIRRVHTYSDTTTANTVAQSSLIEYCKHYVREPGAI